MVVRADLDESGCSVMHRSPPTTSGNAQRGWNGQPVGRLISDGGLPGIGSSRWARSRSSRGIEFSSPHA